MYTRKRGVGPVRKLALAGRTGEDPVVAHRVRRPSAPQEQSLRQLWIERDGLLRCLCLVGADALKRNGTGDVQFEVLEIHVRPFQRQQLAHAQPGENVEKHGGLARLLDVFKQRLDLLDVQRLFGKAA